MGKIINNHDLSMDDPIVSLFMHFLSDYPNKINNSDDYSVDCYIEEYKINGRLCARFRDKKTNKRIEFWVSPNDINGIICKYDVLEFLSEVKRSGHSDFYSRNSSSCISISAILLGETKDVIELASYYSEFFYKIKDGDMELLCISL